MKKKTLKKALATSILSMVFIFLGISCSKDPETPVATVINVDNEGVTTIDNTVLDQQVNAVSTEPLSTDESGSIIFMREEEKLARDAYLVFYQKWGQAIFENISVSEQTHMNAVLLLINRYSLSDPVGANPVGVFTNADLGSLYNTLVSKGNISLTEALKAGAEIEEIDIHDLNAYLANPAVNNKDIKLVYSNLLKASRNHLRAMVKVLQRQGVSYVPQYLTQSEYDAIINSAMESGNS